MKLYELNEEILIAEDAVEAYAIEHDGDVTDCPFEKILDDLKGEKDAKLLGLAAWYKNLNVEAKAVAEEAKKLTARKTALANKAQRIKDYIYFNLDVGKKLSDPKVILKWSSSKSVDVTCDPSTLPLSFTKITVAPDKTALKVALNAGEVFDGVTLKSNNNLQIK